MSSEIVEGVRRRRWLCDDTWEGVEVDTGRRVVSGATRVLSPDWLLDELPLGDDDDVELAAAFALCAALAPVGPESVPLAARVASVGGRLVILGRLDANEARALYLSISPRDLLGLADVVGRPGSARLVLPALASRLAAERHAVVRRAATMVLDARLLRLRVAAGRLARFPPPREVGTLACDGANVTNGTSVVFAEGRLDPRACRLALRASAGEDSPLRRWLVSMSRLRVDREILARR